MKTFFPKGSIFVDYKLLENQFRELAKIYQSKHATPEQKDCLDGVLNLLDAILDRKPFPTAGGEGGI